MDKFHAALATIERAIRALPAPPIPTQHPVLSYPSPAELQRMRSLMPSGIATPTYGGPGSAVHAMQQQLQRVNALPRYGALGPYIPINRPVPRNPNPLTAFGHAAVRNSGFPTRYWNPNLRQMMPSVQRNALVSIEPAIDRIRLAPRTDSGWWD